MTDEREEVAETLRRAREALRDAEPVAREAADVLPPPRPTAEPREVQREAEPAPPPEPVRPDLGALNEGADLHQALPGGLLGRVLRRVLGRVLEAQSTFNSRQVQFDNAVAAYLDARFDRTHGHYDGVLGIHGRHMEEIDQRHLMLQEDLVAHVHDLVKRIDFVLAEGERGRLSMEHALKDLRARLAQLEARLTRGE